MKTVAMVLIVVGLLAGCAAIAAEKAAEWYHPDRSTEQRMSDWSACTNWAYSSWLPKKTLPSGAPVVRPPWNQRLAGALIGVNEDTQWVIFEQCMKEKGYRPAVGSATEKFLRDRDGQLRP
jgi:uncharacterized protein YceK